MSYSLYLCINTCIAIITSSKQNIERVYGEVRFVYLCRFFHLVSIIVHICKVANARVLIMLFNQTELVNYMVTIIEVL